MKNMNHTIARELWGNVIGPLNVSCGGSNRDLWHNLRDRVEKPVEKAIRWNLHSTIEEEFMRVMYD